MISQQTNISVAIVPVMLATGLKCASSNFSCDSDDSDDDFHAQASDASKENAFRSGLVSRKTDFGERVSKDPQGRDHEFNQGLTHFIYDERGNLIAEADSFGGMTREYVYMDSLLIAVLDGDNVYYVHADNLGTPQKMTDGDQRVVWERVAEPFGETLDIKGPATLNLRGAGLYNDAESGLLYNLMRSLDPKTNIYTQSDFIGLRGGINTYIHVGQNPINRIDPTGLDVTVTEYQGGPGNPFGHVGIGIAQPLASSPTIGFYGSPNSSFPQLMSGAPSGWMTDLGVPIQTVTIQTTPWQDMLIANYINNAISNAQQYALTSNNCSSAVGNALSAGGINVPATIFPGTLLNELQQLQPFTPIPQASPISTPVPQQ